MKHFIISFLLLIGFAGNAQGQEYKKIISIVQKMEADLKAMIEQEKNDREASDKKLLEAIQSLKKGDTTGAETPSSENISKELIERLTAGNKRFVEGNLSVKNFKEQRGELTKGQKPYVIVITCSDSRVPPEYIFDEPLGQLFVIRVAGNVVDSVCLGSIEYAAEHLHTPLLLVLGHESCGAVTAAVSGGALPPNIGSLVRRIKPAVDRTTTKHLKDSDVLNACIEENVVEQMEQSVRQSDVLKELSEKGEFRIIGGVYNLSNGSVRFLEKKNVSEEAGKK
jgi:carbonic anhydrase